MALTDKFAEYFETPKLCGAVSILEISESTGKYNLENITKNAYMNVDVKDYSIQMVLYELYVG